MNADLAQCITLTTFGRAILAGVWTPQELLTSHSTFQYVREVSFIDESGRSLSGTSDWFADLKRRGARASWLIRRSLEGELPEHIAVAFAGVDPWCIQIELPEGSEAWISQWQPSRKKNSERRIWSVSYQRFLLNSPVTVESSVGEAAVELERSLREIRGFAAEAAKGWTKWFDKALKALALGGEIPHYTDLLPPEGYSREARALLAAASHAWVFGGMGSWNDLGFNDPVKEACYKAVSGQLYESVLRACFAAANSFRKPESS